jgi:hypothetical protein
MQSDRYLKAVLTVIAVCLVLICLNLVSSANATSEPSGKYFIAGGAERHVYRLHTDSGEICVFMIGVNEFQYCTK